ncbi:MAG: hypothetical protein IKB80_04105 [Oscillospiraceae bacterium]|nr:hypothetical protein [Oscillospiraceae bacterium]
MAVRAQAPPNRDAVYTLKNIHNIHCFLYIIHYVPASQTEKRGCFCDYEQKQIENHWVFWYVKLEKMMNTLLHIYAQCATIGITKKITAPKAEEEMLYEQERH